MLNTVDNAAEENSNAITPYDNRSDVSCSGSSDGESEISMSDKIIIQSNEKRLLKRMHSLQSSIINLKEQLDSERKLWQENMELIKNFQHHHPENHFACSFQSLHHCHCSCSRESFRSENRSRSNSIYSLQGSDYRNNVNLSLSHGDELSKNHSIKQMLELQNYKRKLAETESMCDAELLKVKQSIQDLKMLQSIATEWGNNSGDKNELGNKKSIIGFGESEIVEEIYLSTG